MEADSTSTSASNISVSEGTNLDMNTTMEADGASTSSNNISISSNNISESEGTNSDNASTSSSDISVSEGKNSDVIIQIEANSASSGTLSEGTNPDMEADSEAEIASKSSSNINNQQNVAKMEIFMETWCLFIDSRAKHNVAQETFEICNSKLTIEELSDRLNSTHDNLRASKSRKQIAWEHFPYKGYLAFIYLVVLMLLSFLTLLYGVWWVGLVGLLGGPLSIYLFTPSRTHSTRFKQDWIYTSYLKLRLKLWKIPPPAPDNDMLNPKCIYVPLNIHQTGTWGEWLSAVILPKLQSELGITDMKGLESTIKNAEWSLNDFQKYSLRADSVMGLGSVPLWCFWLLGVVGLLILTIGALCHESDIAKFVSLSGVAAFIKIIYGFVKSNKENVEPDIEANGNIFDVICRLHRVIKKETIFFAVVANELDDFNVMPIKYRRYFKFLIVRNLELYEPYPNYEFIMRWLRYNDIKDSIQDPLADIVFNYIINKRFIAESEECENKFEFLRLLHKMNNDNNNILSNWSMLHLVRCSARLSYSDSRALELQLFLSYNESSRPAKISHLDLQAMGLYTTPIKLKIEKLKKNAYTVGGSNSIHVVFCCADQPPIAST